jgi:uncharacterized protein (DUF934 family)
MENKIIKKNAIINNEWRIITDTGATEIPFEKVIVPLVLWNRLYDTLSRRNEPPGLLLNSDEHPADFIGTIAPLKLIAVNFPAFTDGRGFSIGNLIRERYHYQGELRAYGSFIPDQLYYLKRCGFDSFQFSNNIELDNALHSLRDFSDSYQMSSIDQSPLFRRRKSMT